MPAGSSRFVPNSSDPRHPREVPAGTRHPHYSSVGSLADAMSIPRTQQAVPPPLPPPSFIPEIASGNDLGWQWGNESSTTQFGRAPSMSNASANVRPGSSLHGGSYLRDADRHFDHQGRSPRTYAMNDERHSSMSAMVAERGRSEQGGLSRSSEMDWRPTSNFSLHGERQLEHRTRVASSNTYDKQLLSRISNPSSSNSAKRQSLSFSPGTSAQESTQLAPIELDRRGEQLRPLTLPLPYDRIPNSQEFPAGSSAQWPGSAVSPGSSVPASWAEHRPHEGLVSNHQPHAHPHHHHTRPGSRSYEGSAGFSDDVDDGRLHDLRIGDQKYGSQDSRWNSKSGTKRRASSPPRDLSRDDRTITDNLSPKHDASQRQPLHQLPLRESLSSRFHPNHSSLSSASSSARHGSLGSSLGMASIPSSTTSFASGQLSPGGSSPSYDDENRTDTIYSRAPTAKSASASQARQHQRGGSIASVSGPASAQSESSPHSRNSSVNQLSGATFVCECCPKKPKKFDTAEDLRLHESEKQYTCAYCSNRFKNKNEAERHQNSLHLRRHSWSCAALAGVEAAFHPSVANPAADICGYCGDEFPNPACWQTRAAHLNVVHKFGECNQAKKFFRADHFRQHLKHSHAGTSGKWTNLLENACMKDEPLPEKRADASGPSSSPATHPMASSSAMHSASSGGPTLPAAMLSEFAVSRYPPTAGPDMRHGRP
ncbi:uncharacterized protein K489DRAFT_383119 [Dissoconium aciculare CBS 342.82]|uniref:C2H2-type domain-containing protein n=1 Tax=Dissoconium aciculare CBS 342.82 TaxID=1314786 RepID=A0A6J3LX38_9PEZI|nr:uncharacterized protein K489DRAFT_383119 [Dissoconium aciculare CBS 342.82]KAF1820315.1 hypothetical protein K489DRAFT_383119 [Dissoconium aciculare CBS 342.82]